MTVEKKFSKNLLEMKFMQKTKHKLDEKKITTENRRLEKQYLAEAATSKISETPAKKIELIYEKRRQNLENVHECGRFSFENFNPEVEKCMQINQNLEERKLLAFQDKKDGKEIEDEEFAKRYTSLKTTLNKKFAPKKRKIRNPGEEKEKGFKNPKIITIPLK
uniref:M-phase phosphoprotein 6 n=1 Tax=Romanomermis culicivorax TaxID=13658 RepID=A0A915INV6_ROMCU